MNPKNQFSFWRTRPRLFWGVLVTLVLVAATLFFQKPLLDFLAAVLKIEKHAPFDGTSLPIARVPNWATLKTAEYKLAAADLPADKWVPLPNYDSGVFGTQLASLNWQADRTLINQLITFAVPYMGSYATGSREYEGSHLAVDIKTPVGTEVLAVANGQVVKVAESGNGFGLHVVIRHDNVPLLSSNETATLYSGYAHLSAVQVTPGQIVTRGQVIGLSGNTGTSTTPHLHFQIDRDSAPWHPWWPFSSAEATAAGLDFFGGVTAGLGKDAAAANTVNPMLWVQRYLVTTPVQPAGTTLAAAEPLHTAATPPTPPPAAATPPPPDALPTAAAPSAPATTTAAPTPAADRFQISGDQFALVGNAAQLKVTLLDANGMPNTTGQPRQNVQLKSAQGSVQFVPSLLTPADFVNGVATVNVKSDVPQTVQLALADSVTAAELRFIAQVATIAKFGVELPNGALIETPSTVVIRALDSSGEPTPSSQIGGTVRLSTSTGLGTFAPETLSASDFHDGVATVQLTYPASSSFTVRAQEGALVGVSSTVEPQLFTDLTDANANYTAIAALKKRGIISGYPDGSFQPTKTVSRVEALKMLLGGLQIAGRAGRLKFADADSAAWYAPFVGAAIERKIAGGYPDGTFRPGNTVNRAEYLKLLLNAAGIATPAVTTAPYDDVPADSWYAPFAAAAKAANLVPTTGSRLAPSDGMTRAEVAETIYRLMVLRSHGDSVYSSSQTLD